MLLLSRLLLCIAVAGVFLYLYINKVNDLTELRLNIPILARELKEIKEKNLELQYLIDCFESPLHLIEMADKPEFGHLKYPMVEDIFFIPEPQIAPCSYE